MGRGRIELICGCMFSGKSELLLDRIEAARQAGRTVAAFKHASDNRYCETDVVTHGGRREPASPVATASELVGARADVIAIDEAQFFSDELVEVCRQLAEGGRDVLVAGLDRNCWGEPFSPIPELAVIADEVTRTTARCARCGQEAMFTQRLTPIAGGQMIGGAESYEPRCATCFRPPEQAGP